MKLITINVSDEEHKEIKLKATEAGLSIKDYLLGFRRVDAVSKPDQLPIKPLAEWTGPIFRDKKKSKL